MVRRSQYSSAPIDPAGLQMGILKYSPSFGKFCLKRQRSDIDSQNPYQSKGKVGNNEDENGMCCLQRTIEDRMGDRVVEIQTGNMIGVSGLME